MGVGLLPTLPYGEGKPVHGDVPQTAQASVSSDLNAKQFHFHYKIISLHTI